MRECILCKKNFEYCPSCAKDKHKASWHKLYCSENCKDIFHALNNYNFKLATKEETQRALRKCDLSINLNAHCRSEIREIMKKPVEFKPQHQENEATNVVEEVVKEN